MINSLLELVGALFLASLPILLTLARIRRRRMRAAAAREAAAREPVGGGTDGGARASTSTSSAEQAGGARQRSRPRAAWLDRIFGRSRRVQASAAAPAQAPAQQRQKKRSEDSESRKDWAAQSEGEYRSLPQTPPGEALLKRAERYPPLQRAIVLKEILGPPKGLE